MTVASSISVSRRAVLGGALGVTLGSSRAAHAGTTSPPVLYVSHGSPLFLPGNEARRGALGSWGVGLARPRGIVVMTPHYASRRLELGHTGRGRALYDLPGPIQRRLPPRLEYATPPSESLAEQVEALVSGSTPVSRGQRGGFDHTTWMPLSCLFPAADVPTLEISYPYLPEPDLFALGQKLAPLREEGVLFVASGQVTHNLATFSPDSAPPPWAREFDAWTAESVTRQDVDALVDWRRKAPGVELAHPDDGGHYRVLLVALGVALGSARSARTVRFPITGFEATMSTRCMEMAT
jgi:4,5-DOPA dioxygenase extradiol